MHTLSSRFYEWESKRLSEMDNLFVGVLLFGIRRGIGSWSEIFYLEIGG